MEVRRRGCDAARVRGGDRQASLNGHPELACGIGDWDASVYGNHRIVVAVDEPAPAVSVTLPWRRHDGQPEKVDTIVVSAAGRRIRNVVRERIEAAAGQLTFEPIDGAGDYYVYYLPFAHTGSAYYPHAVYRVATPTADPAWLLLIGSPGAATAVRYEAASAIDSLAPMGFSATPAEVDAVLAAYPDEPFLLFGDDRQFGIGRADYLPARWCLTGPGAPLRLDTDRGEFRVFQIGVYATRDIVGIATDLAALPFPARNSTGGGLDARGHRFDRDIAVKAGHVQSLWLAVEVPLDAAPGAYRAPVTVTAAGVRSTVEVEFVVSAERVADGGAADPHRLARLAWLDSTLGQDDEIVPPFTPIERTGRRLAILGREFEIGEHGLPNSIGSQFTRAMTSISHDTREILAGPITFDIGRKCEFGELTISTAGPARVCWNVSATAPDIELDIAGEVEADGFAEIRITATASADVDIDATFSVPVREDVAHYAMGLGLTGRTCPVEFDWSWDVATRNQDALWIGDVNAGPQIALRDEHYRRPLNTNYYREQPLVAPRSWANDGNGGIRIRSADITRTISAFSGPISLRAGESRRFDIRLLITPFKPIEPRRQLTERYFHGYETPEHIADYGANVINVHHATPPNPYLNDPMRAIATLAEYSENAHRRGMRVKVYDTVRELTRHIPELPALVSLGHEVFARGPGGGHAWLQEHLPGDHVPGWVAPTVDDVAVVTTGDSRWHNAYVESLSQLARTTGIDGIYLDDIAFDRTTMKRVRKVLAAARPQPLVDLHSASQYTERDGYASSANLYLEHLPYIDRLWFGEYIDYDGTDPAYWLVEIAGIPFGVMGEMLEGGGNPWRGLVFGMTARAPRVDNRALWQVIDEMGLADMDMIGWWAGNPPIHTDHPDVLATSWRNEHDERDERAAAVALASWAAEPVTVRLSTDLVLHAPSIPDFQPAATFAAGDPIPVEPGKGWLLAATNGPD